MALIYLFIVSFIQNLFFTWVSRSRNAGDAKYHFFVALGSNGVWFICNFFLIFPQVMESVVEGSLWDRILVMVVYTISTALGSAFMMKVLLGHIKLPKFLHKILVEDGKRKVGS